MHPRTLARWADSGRIGYFRTLGGHRRYYEDEVLALVLGPEYLGEHG